jgi:amidase
MKRRQFLKWAAVGCASAMSPAQLSAARKEVKPRPGARFELEELTVAELQTGMQSGQFTAVGLTRKYLEVSDKMNTRGPALRAVLEINPDALKIARELDHERKAGRTRGPLHGVPILLKDNIDTHDRMTCTAGSLALLGSQPSRDAFLVQRLRACGAVILGKTNLSEWANFRGARSISGWSGRGGFTRNPYVLDRNPSGSSSGSAVAVSANLCALSVGTETNGSIVSPASYTGIVGVKPTVGLISQGGIIPIAHSQDTAGPMARTVRDAALLLSCLAAPDPEGTAGNAGLVRPSGLAELDYTKELNADGLKGARIGVVRRFFHKYPVSLKPLEEAAVESLRAAGAVVVDPVEIPEKDLKSHEVMLYEFKAGLNAYLATLGPSVGVQSLKQIIVFNEQHRDTELRWFGQETLLAAEEKGPLTDAAYLDAVANSRRSAREEGLDRVLREHSVDALVAPTAGPAHVTDRLHGDRDTGGSSTPAAVAGYPSVTVPAGFVEGLPFGISFFGPPWSEATLLKFAYAFEQVTQHRRPPEFKPTLE